MDKYIIIVEEPKYNLMIKETLCNCSRFQKLMHSYDNGRYAKWNIKPIYKQEYTKKSYNKQNTLNKSVKSSSLTIQYYCKTT